MKKIYIILIALMTMFFLMFDDCDNKSSDTVQQEQQEKILAEGTSQVGMPAIKNFRERKLLKDIYEMRDQNIATFTYLWSEYQCRFVFLGESIGYGIPYSEQFTSPQKLEWKDSHGYFVVPQADPNGLFSPSSSEGTWVLLKNPHGKDVKPVYIEPRILVSPFRLE